MSIFLQIAIPLLVTTAALVAIAIWRKYIKPETVVMVVVALALGVGTLVGGISSSDKDGAGVGKLSSSDAVSLMVAEQYALQGEYGEAADILEELDRRCPDDKDVQLARARLAMLMDDYAGAISLYKLADSEHSEIKTAQQLMSAKANSGDDAVIHYLTSNGYDPKKYGLESSSASKVDADSAKKDILDTLKANRKDYRTKYGKEAVQAVEQAADITTNFRLFVQNKSADTQVIQGSTKTLNRLMEKSADLQCNPYLREARLKGFVAMGDYDALAESAGEFVTSEELVVLTELFVSDLIDRKDFSSEFTKLDSEKTDEMIEHCLKVLEDSKDTISGEQYDRYKTRIEQFKQRADDPVLFALQSYLTAGAHDKTESMRSKLFLALAKLEYDQGNVKNSEEYVEDALGTSADSDDENYRVPMMQMTSIIQGNSDSEDVKNIAEYVDKAINNSLSEGLPSEILVPSKDKDDTVNNQNNYGSGSSAGNASSGSDTVKESFSDHMEDQIVKTTAMLNIGVINKDNFPNVQARVQIQSQKWTSYEEIKKHLQVYDCGSNIDNFNLEKLTFQRSRIVLLCDVSGSMSGNEDALKDAIVTFAKNMTPGEEVSVVAFSSDIVFQEPFSSDPKVVASYADKININGGTALYDSVITTLDQFTPDINSNDIIIAMTDGQDGRRYGEADMHNGLGAKAASQGVTVYTMGLGSGVDVEYLEMMAKHGNGSFLYANDVDKMNTFYAFIHGQLANQYILSFNAKNQTLNERLLELSIEDELGRTQKTYYLQDPVYDNSDGDSYDAYVAVDSELTVYGFSTKFLYKSTSAQKIELKGEGFDAGDDVTITLTGSVQYKLKPTFVDSSTYTVEIPSEFATGTYDLKIMLRGTNITLEDELTIAAYGTQKTFKFGDYHFTALKSYTSDDGKTVLSGNVTMNGWLMFKGDVTITGAYNNAERVTLNDESGCVVAYKATTAEGLAKYLAEKNIPLYMPKLGDFTIYNTPYTAMSYDDFPVDKVTYANELNIKFMKYENGSISVYPDMLQLQGFNIHYNLPFQEQLMRNFDIGRDYKYNVDTKVLLNATQIAMKGKVDYSNLKETDFTMVSLPLSMDSFSVEIDTLVNNYSLEAEVGFKAIKGMDGLKFSFGVVGGKFDSVGLGVDGDAASVTLITAPVPVSMSKFGFELSGFSKYESNNSTLSNILGTTITINFQVDVASLNKYLPKISELISDDEVALATLKDCALSLNLKEFRLAFNADVVLMTVLDIGKCEIELGKFDYTNALIGYYDETQYGLRAKVTVGSKWETNNLSLELSGSSEITFGYPYSGLWLSGGMDFDIGWWILRANVDVSGDALIGAYKNSSDKLQFSIIVRGTDKKGKHDGFHLYFVDSGSLQINTY